MGPTVPGSKPPEITKPKPVVQPTGVESGLSGAADWGLRNTIVGVVSYIIASLSGPLVTNYMLGPIPVLSEEEKKRNEIDKKKILAEIKKIEDKQEEEGRKITGGKDREFNRTVGAPLEMLKRWVAGETPSVKALRVQLNSLEIKDRFYTALEKLTFWLTFVIVAYYLNDPINTLVSGRRRRLDQKVTTGSASAADNQLHANDVLLDKKIDDLQKDYIDLLKEIAGIQKEFIDSQVDLNQDDNFVNSLQALQQKLDDLLTKIEALQAQK